ncbi:hypothetical protein DFJ73DRAFT_809037 [Zopfochytrium polystomum]|nr:hypothetical protein DFJ73DRAFT_809037 [Zopfochytrium polystomum]
MVQAIAVPPPPQHLLLVHRFDPDENSDNAAAASPSSSCTASLNHHVRTIGSFNPTNRSGKAGCGSPLFSSFAGCSTNFGGSCAAGSPWARAAPLILSSGLLRGGTLLYRTVISGSSQADLSPLSTTTSLSFSPTPSMLSLSSPGTPSLFEGGTPLPDDSDLSPSSPPSLFFEEAVLTQNQQHSTPTNTRQPLEQQQPQQQRPLQPTHPISHLPSHFLSSHTHTPPRSMLRNQLSSPAPSSPLIGSPSLNPVSHRTESVSIADIANFLESLKAAAAPENGNPASSSTFSSRTSSPSLLADADPFQNQQEQSSWNPSMFSSSAILDYLGQKDLEFLEELQNSSSPLLSPSSEFQREAPSFLRSIPSSDDIGDFLLFPDLPSTPPTTVSSPSLSPSTANI